MAINWDMYADSGRNVASGLGSLMDLGGISAKAKNRAALDQKFSSLASLGSPETGAMTGLPLRAERDRQPTGPAPEQFAGNPQPAQQFDGPMGGFSNKDLIEIIRNPEASDGERAMVLDEYKRRTTPKDPYAERMKQLQLKKAEYEASQLGKSSPQYLEFGNQLLRMDGPNGPQVVMQGQGKPDYNDPNYIFETRKAQAAQLGITPDDPRYASYVGTGKMPREDAQPLSATDKKAILEADEMVMANETAITALQEAKKLSPQANQGWFAGARAGIANNLPDWMVPDAVSSPESGQATANLDNAVVGQALAQLKTIFGGAPTEGERQILLDLQGSSSLPELVRQQIYDRAIRAAQQRLEFNRQRAAQLRNQEYYKGGGPQRPAPATAPAGVDPADWEFMTPEERQLFQ